ncbi:MAG TPA: cytochrome c oxidase assembly protein [Actinomycetota bacterium]|nr:cytochrome c oxidase assembly protein [Actinomycetota bacterium]
MPVPVFLSLVCAGALYLLGTRRLERRAARWRATRTWCFLGGIAVLVMALGPPLDGDADRLLSAHMVQHLLLMQVAAPLLLLGRPITLALAASSGRTRMALARIAHGRIARIVGSPVVGFACFALVLWVSHLTGLYEAALTDETVHAVEHLAFLAAALLFWWPIVARDPGAARLSFPARILYVFMSMPVMSLLGYVIASSGRLLYPHYALVSGVTSALADQRLGGTIMWEGSMLVGVAALSAVLIDWMGREEREALRADLRRGRTSPEART